jgi:hypothetical protein
MLLAIRSLTTKEFPMRTRGVKVAGLIGCLLIALIALAATFLPKLGAEPSARLGEEKTASESKDRVALAESRVAIERGAMKVAEAHKKMVAAKLTSARSRVAAARAAEAFSEKQFKRMESLENSVSQAVVREFQAKWDAARTGRTVAEDNFSECEAGVALEEAKVDLARLKVEDAELRLKQLKAKVGAKP